jgi:hypothetical protein
LKFVVLALCLCALVLHLGAGSAQAADGVPYAYRWPDHEWGAPSGAYAGKRPLGHVLIVHGGAWTVVGRAQIEAARYKADEFRARGWATLNTTYRAGGSSWMDVAAMGDLMRHRAGPGAPLCLWGGSAGGHLAMVAATLKPYDCVISEAGPTDLTSVVRQTANGSALGPLKGYQLAIDVFGRENLWVMSPLRVASDIKGRLLLATAVTDPIVPLEQMAQMKAARPATETMRLEGGSPGDYYFVHSYISGPAKGRFDAAVDATLAGARRDVASREAARTGSVGFAARSKGAWFSSMLPVSVVATRGASRVELRVDGRRVATDRRAPFSFAYRPSRKVKYRRHRLSAVASLPNGHSVSASTRVRRVRSKLLRSACAKATRRVRAARSADARRSARLTRDRRCPWSGGTWAQDPRPTSWSPAAA